MFYKFVLKMYIYIVCNIQNCFNNHIVQQIEI